MKTRTRSRVPAPCRHPKARHVHGTAVAYEKDGCGCDSCYEAFLRERKPHRFEAALAPVAPAPAPTPLGSITARGQFVATFPFLGGMSIARLRRHVRWPFLELAEQQGVQLLPGEPVIRIDRTGAGDFVVVSQPGLSRRPAAEVRRRAAEMAYEHEQAHPLLAKWITKHLHEEAA